MFLGKVKVLKHLQLDGDIYKLTVERPQTIETVSPGQFFMITANAYLLKRPISVSGITTDTIEFTIRTLGEGTNTIVQLNHLEIMGPLGNGFTTNSYKSILIVGGGVGVAPLLPVAKLYSDSRTKIYSSLGFREKPIMCNDFEESAHSIQIVSETASNYLKGYPTEYAEKVLQSESVDMIFACGPKTMMKEVAKLSEAYGVPAQLLLEEKMACGIGACLGCTCKTKEGAFGFKHSKVCKDGPMFWADEVIFDGN